MSRDWLLFLDDLIESSGRIQRITEGLDFTEFQKDISAHDAVLMNLLDVVFDFTQNIRNVNRQPEAIQFDPGMQEKGPRTKQRLSAAVGV